MFNLSKSRPPSNLLQVTWLSLDKVDPGNLYFKICPSLTKIYIMAAAIDKVREHMK